MKQLIKKEFIVGVISVLFGSLGIIISAIFAPESGIMFSLSVGGPIATAFVAPAIIARRIFVSSRQLANVMFAGMFLTAVIMVISVMIACRFLA